MVEAKTFSFFDVYNNKRLLLGSLFYICRDVTPVASHNINISWSLGDSVSWRLIPNKCIRKVLICSWTRTLFLLQL